MGLREMLDRCGKSCPPTGVRYPEHPARSESPYKIDTFRAVIYIYFSETCSEVYVLSDGVKASNIVAA